MFFDLGNSGFGSSLVTLPLSTLASAAHLLTHISQSVATSVVFTLFSLLSWANSVEIPALVPPTIERATLPCKKRLREISTFIYLPI